MEHEYLKKKKKQTHFMLPVLTHLVDLAYSPYQLQETEKPKINGLLVREWLYKLPPCNNKLYLFHIFHRMVSK